MLQLLRDAVSDACTALEEKGPPPLDDRTEGERCERALRLISESLERRPRDTFPVEQLELLEMLLAHWEEMAAREPQPIH